MERKNIKSPAGWLRAALKNDYRGEGQESQPVRMDSRMRENDPSETRFHGAGIKGSGNDKILSTEDVKKRFRSLREQLIAMKQ